MCEYIKLLSIEYLTPILLMFIAAIVLLDLDTKTGKAVLYSGIVFFLLMVAVITVSRTCY